MCETIEVKSIETWEGSPVVMMARVQSVDGTNITQEVVSSIEIKVFNKADNTQVGSTLNPSVASTVYNTLQTGYGWSEDSTGFNFRYEIAGSYFADGDMDYRVEIIFTPLTGSPFAFVADVTTKNLLSN